MRRIYRFLVVIVIAASLITSFSYLVDADNRVFRHYTEDGNTSFTQVWPANITGITYNSINGDNARCEWQVGDNNSGSWTCMNRTSYYTCSGNTCTAVSGGSADGNNYTIACSVYTSGSTETVSCSRNGMSNYTFSLTDDTGNGSSSLTNTGAIAGWPVRYNSTNPNDLTILNISCSAGYGLGSVNNDSTCVNFLEPGDGIPCGDITGATSDLCIIVDNDLNNYSVALSVTGTDTKTIQLSRNGMSNISASWNDQDNIGNFVNTDGYINVTNGSTTIINWNISKIANNTITGLLTSTDWLLFNSSRAANVSSVAATIVGTSAFSVSGSPITTSGTLTFTFQNSTSSQDGILRSADFISFNEKANNFSVQCTNIADRMYNVTLNSSGSYAICGTDSGSGSGGNASINGSFTQYGVSFVQNASLVGTNSNVTITQDSGNLSVSSSICLSGHCKNSWEIGFNSFNGTTASQSNSLNSTSVGGWTNISNLTLYLPSGFHNIECYIAESAAAATTGVRFIFNVTNTTARNHLLEYYTSTTAQALAQATSVAMTVGATASSGTTISPARYYGHYVVDVEAVFWVQFATEVNASAVTVNIGSYCRSFEATA